MKRAALLIGVGVGVVGLVLLSDDEMLKDLLAGITGRGSRVGPRTSVDSAGVVEDDPRGLADAAGLTMDVYALARVLSSEAGSESSAAKLAVGWATKNKAGSGGAIASLVLRGSGAAYGQFARQNAGGKWCSSSADPYQDDVRIAQAVISETLADPTGGAVGWFSPALQDYGHDKWLGSRDVRFAGYTKSAAEVDSAWRAGGLEPVVIAGVAAQKITFYRRA